MIKGISEVRRLPRLGKIRLGIKKESAKGVSYPSEVDYFLLDPETPDQKRNDQLKEQFEDLYGKNPKRIKIMFPPASPEIFFAQWYKRYGSGALLKCKGDGEVAETTEEFAAGLEKIGETDRGFIKVKCLGGECVYQTGSNEYCQKPQCNTMAALQVILPELSGIGVWQINTGSFNSIVNINSALEWLRGLCGRYSMIPLWLMRVPTDIAYEGKKSKHYILQIDQNVSIGEIQKFVSLTPVERALIPGPDETKDDLYYGDHGERPQIAGPVDETASQDAVKSTISDGPEAEAPAKEAPAAKASDKKGGPLKASFEEEQKSRARMNELFEGIKTCKIQKHVLEYIEILKSNGDLKDLLPGHKTELSNKVNNYLKEITKKEKKA